jgi:hypothetical protein
MRTATTNKKPARSRYVVVFAVAASHVALIALLVAASRSRSARRSAGPATAVVFFVPQPQAQPTPPPTPGRRVSAPRPDRPPGPERTSTPQVSPPVPEENSSTAIHPEVDWYREAGRSAAKMARSEAAKRGTKLVPEEHDTPSKRTWWPKGVHQAGEEENDRATGETIEWINDRCYVAVERPPPGTPDFLARARTSKMGCRDPSAGAARGDLFDKLPAYKKLHPDE